MTNAEDFGTPDTVMGTAANVLIAPTPTEGNPQAEAYAYAHLQGVLAEVTNDLAIFHNRVLNAIIPDGYKAHLLECIEVIHRKAEAGSK